MRANKIHQVNKVRSELGLLDLDSVLTAMMIYIGDWDVCFKQHS